MSEARALWFTDKSKAEIKRETLNPLTEGWCEVNTMFTAISPGTERLVFSGQVPEEVYSEMRCPYMGGDFPSPVKYGYSLVGKVMRGSSGLIGSTVHLLHPHQDRCRVRESDVFIIPGGIPLSAATLISSLETAVNAVWDSKITPGERALVVGFGIIGSLLVRVLDDMTGIKANVVDTDSQKVSLARRLGFSADNSSRVGQKNYDVAYHTSGTGAGLQFSIDHVGFEGRIIELSWFGNRPVSLNLGGTFHSYRKQIISSQVSHIPRYLSSKWSKQKRKELVGSLLQNRRYDLHITHSTSFEKLPRVFRKLQHSYHGLGYLVTYS